MAKSESKIRISEQSTLKWADGWNRTAIADRKAKPVWRKPFSFYREALISELAKIGAIEALLTFNTDPLAVKRDPGVTIYFSKPIKEDFGWQLGLGIDNPVPTLEQIDDAYKRKAMQTHPDRGGDIEVFKKLGEYRVKAIAWVKGTHDHEYALPCDRFSEPRWNLNALRLGLASLRRLEEFGLPGMLDRTFRGFRVALPAKASGEESHVDKAVNA